MTDEQVFSLNDEELLENYEIEGDTNVAFYIDEKPSTGFTWNVDTSECGAKFKLIDSSYDNYQESEYS